MSMKASNREEGPALRVGVAMTVAGRGHVAAAPGVVDLRRSW
jgi:hypothetical protein